jgi:SNF family Na+-dependent transporter
MNFEDTVILNKTIVMMVNMFVMIIIIIINVVAKAMKGHQNKFVEAKIIPAFVRSSRFESRFEHYYDQVIAWLFSLCWQMSVQSLKSEDTSFRSVIIQCNRPSLRC